MSNATISDYTNVATDRFDKAVPIYLNNEIPLLQIFNKGKVEKFDSEKAFKLPFQYQQPQGSSWTGEGVATPTALLSAFNQMSLTWKKIVGTIRLSEEAIDLTKGSLTFINGWARESAGMLRTIKNDLDTAVHKSGRGKLCSVTSISGQVVTCDTTRYIQPGMVLAGYDDSNNINGLVAGHPVTIINSETTFTVTGDLTSTVGGSATVDSGTYFYKLGTWVTSGSTQYAANGIANIVDDDDLAFQGTLTRALYPMLKAKIGDGDNPGVPQALTLARMRDIVDQVVMGPYGGSPGCIYGSLGTYNAYTDIMRSATQPVETMPAKDGYPGGAIYHQGDKDLPVIASVKATPDTMFFLSKETLFKYFGKMGWADRDGMMQRVAGYLIYESIYRGWCNFGTNYPSANGRLNDITET